MPGTWNELLTYIISLHSQNNSTDWHCCYYSLQDKQKDFKELTQGHRINKKQSQIDNSRQSSVWLHWGTLSHLLMYNNTWRVRLLKYHIKHLSLSSLTLENMNIPPQYGWKHRCCLLPLVKNKWASGNLVSTPITTNLEKYSSEDECYLCSKKDGIHLNKIEGSFSIISQFHDSHLSLTQHVSLSFRLNNVLEKAARLLKHSYLYWVGIHFFNHWELIPYGQKE